MLMPRDRYGLSLFDEMLNDPFFKKSENNRSSIMKTDIYEKDGFYHLEMELPGYAKENIQAELKDGYLTVSASKKENKDQKNEKGQYIRRERYAGSMSRSYYVGKDLDEKDVHAKFEDGILKVTFPKEKPAQVEEQNVISIEG